MLLVTDSIFQPGSIVRDNRSKLGRVVGVAGSVEVDGVAERQFTVDFWGGEERRLERWLTPLDEDCPEALLLDRPDELASWADDAPLKLVALALSADGGTGKVADIRAKLDGRVIEEGRWKNWWSKRSKALATLPKHFGSVKAPKGNEYTLLSDVGDVPADWKPPAKPKAATATDWRKWLQSGAPAPPPGRFPTRQVANSYAAWSSKWPNKTVNDTLFGLISRAEEIILDGSMNAQAAEGWLSAIARGAIRWRETGQGDTAGYAAARLGGVMAQMAKLAGERTPRELLLQAAALDGKADAWRRGFLAGLWESFEGEDAREVYVNSSGILGRQARGDLAREMFLSAFGPEFSERRHAELDRLLDALPEEQRLQLLREAIASAAPDQRMAVVSYISSSHHASGPENLELRMVAVLTLSGEQSDLAKRTSSEVADAINSKTALAAQSTFPAFGGTAVLQKRPAAAVLDDAARVAQEEIANKDREIADLRRAHEEQLEQERKEQERLRQQVRQRNADLAARREESRLEIRRDMLLAIGEVLQLARLGVSCNETIGNVEAGLRLALRAGGAEVLESAPGGYDAGLHSSEEELANSTPVRVVAPGIVVRGETDGDLVLLKAKVSREAG